MSIAWKVYHTLLDHYGRQRWWPAQSAFEVAVGAVLVQNTAWRNVEQAVSNLRKANALTPSRMAELTTSELAELVRPSGYYRLKAKRLRNLVDFINGAYDGSLDAMRGVESTELRRQLLGINGVGPETADSILLYALDKPALVVDAYTLRVWSRHGWIEHDADYLQLQARVARQLPVDVELYNELHALLVRVGHLHCRRQARCDECPLREMLPESGIVLPSR